jgi:hypothetical protein
MDYDFPRAKSKIKNPPNFVFAVALDRDTLKERILVGEQREVGKLLRGEDGEVFYDETRPIGQLLFGFKSDPDKSWIEHAEMLLETYNPKEFRDKVSSTLDIVRFKRIEPVREWLREQYSNGIEGDNPELVFAAVKTWHEYLICWHEAYSTKRFKTRTGLLYRMFSAYNRRKMLIDTFADVESIFEETSLKSKSQFEIIPESDNCPVEYIRTSSSFRMIILYYLTKLRKWGYLFKSCAKCKRYFLTQARQSQFCSDRCRKERRIETKSEYRGRVQSDSAEKSYAAAYHHWDSRLRKLKDKPEQHTEFKKALDDFCKEAKKRKSAVKLDKSKLPAFVGWIYDERERADNLLERLLE